MPESFATKIDRLKFNIFPAYRGSGTRVLYIAEDYREMRVKIPLSWRTRNYIGTICGGSLYAGIDSIYTQQGVNLSFSLGELGALGVILSHAKFAKNAESGTSIISILKPCLTPVLIRNIRGIYHR